MNTNRQIKSAFAVSLLVLFFGIVSTAHPQSDDATALKAQSRTLMDALKYTEALPLNEKLVVLLPKDPEAFQFLGFSLLAQATNSGDLATRRQLRIRARNAFISARDLGNDSLFIKGMIDGIPQDGADGAGFSDNAEANKAMAEGEAQFTSGNMDGAFASYQAALKLDPRCYYAALFSGDVRTSQQKWGEAEKWYQQAIKIDPNRETAYRYSATPLMRQGKTEEARDRYVEAYVIAPYDKLAVSGIVQWAQATKTQAGHPKLNIPATTVGADGKSNTTINVNPLNDDGSMAWIAYSATREEWKKSKFAKAFPNASYRHTLLEEADALRSVVSMAKTLKPKSFDSEIAMIEKMDKDGVLEAYVLLAIPDRDVAEDHQEYLKNNRDKLKLYVVKYVLGSSAR